MLAIHLRGFLGYHVNNYFTKSDNIYTHTPFWESDKVVDLNPYFIGLEGI